jgi:hypothetical protein
MQPAAQATKTGNSISDYPAINWLLFHASLPPAELSQYRA